MQILVIAIHVIVSFALILIVLLQTGKGADIGAAFGGGSSQTLFGSSGAGNFLTKATTVAAIVFMCTSLALAYYSGHKSQRSVMKESPVSEEAPAAPAQSVPALPPAGGNAGGVAPSVPVPSTGVPVATPPVKVPIAAANNAAVPAAAPQGVKVNVPVSGGNAQPVKVEVPVPAAPAPAAKPAAAAPAAKPSAPATAVQPPPAASQVPASQPAAPVASQVPASQPAVPAAQPAEGNKGE